MELEGHPTQDIVEELERRGALAHPGTEAGPDPETLEIARRKGHAERGLWLFLSKETYDTGVDEEPRMK